MHISRDQLPQTQQRQQGVHVFLDMHQDAYSTTNGGEGIPYWVAADFQESFGDPCRNGGLSVLMSFDMIGWFPEKAGLFGSVAFLF